MGLTDDNDNGGNNRGGRRLGGDGYVYGLAGGDGFTVPTYPQIRELHTFNMHNFS